MKTLEKITLEIIPGGDHLKATLTVNGQSRSRKWEYPSEAELNAATYALFTAAHREAMRCLNAYIKLPKNWKRMTALCLCRISPVVMKAASTEAFQMHCKLVNGKWYMECPCRRWHLFNKSRK